MSALFFGDSAQQLFGFHHPSRGAAVGAVVLCPSWGAEYQFAHRALKVLATRLAERGLHVLRFDYSGTGDSWGSTTDADMMRWTQDTALAIRTVQALSGVSRVDVLGLRVGALVAAMASVGRTDVARLVMWDPVIDGPSWVQGQLTSASPVAVSPRPQPVEFGNRLVSTTLVRQFTEISANGYPGLPGVPVQLMRTLDGHEHLDAQLSHMGYVERRVVQGVSPWLEDSSIWHGLIPSNVITALLDWMPGR